MRQRITPKEGVVERVGEGLGTSKIEDETTTLDMDSELQSN